MKKIVACIITVSFIFTVIGCATIISGRNQDLPVISNPSGARVIVNGVQQQSPCTLVLDRKQPMYQVRVEKDGYEPVEITLRKGVNGWIWGNLLFGGIIGVIVDLCTGSVHKFTPTELEVNLAQKKLGLNDITGKDILIVKLIERK
jgi:hypothetical protein